LRNVAKSLHNFTKLFIKIAPQIAPTMKVTAILKGRIDTNGKQKIYIRTNLGKARMFKATMMKASPGEWDKEKGRCKPSHPQAPLYNANIKKLIIQTEATAITHEASEYQDADLFDYALRCIDIDWRQKSPETLRQYRSEINKMRDFTQAVKLSQVTVAFLNRYKQHCYHIGNSENTTWKTFKFWRTVIRKAHREKRIRENAFSAFEFPKYTNPNKYYLTEDEVRRIEEFSTCEKTKGNLAFVAKWFVIGCYTGLRYGDMKQFNKEEHIKNKRLTLYTSKTGELVSIKFKDRLKELFERVEYKRLALENQYYNRCLKDIQQECKIKCNLTAHVSRHTFGVACAEKGLSIETTARLMSHTSIKTTAIYYKITNKRLDSEVDKLF
jgi:site-specific recombinase XerD